MFFTSAFETALASDPSGLLLTGEKKKEKKRSRRDCIVRNANKNTGRRGSGKGQAKDVHVPPLSNKPLAFSWVEGFRLQRTRDRNNGG